MQPLQLLNIVTIRGFIWRNSDPGNPKNTRLLLVASHVQAIDEGWRLLVGAKGGVTGKVASAHVKHEGISGERARLDGRQAVAEVSEA